MEYLFVVLAGMLIGMMIGLLPVLPIYFGPFLLYMFTGSMSAEQMIVFWACALIGSQFFGSISTITLKIPGEASSLVYINDINKMSLSERASLLFTTAKGSFVAGMLAIIIVYFVVQFVNANDVLIFSGTGFQLSAYTFALLSFYALHRNIWVTSIMLFFGVLLGPQNNYVLPTSWYHVQEVFSGTTLFMVVMGLMVIPQLVLYKSKADTEPLLDIDKKGLINRWQVFKNSMIGAIAGLIPGPASTLSSTIAYRLQKKPTNDKIVAAETANNSAVITEMIPVFLLALPFTSSAIIFMNIMDIKAVDIIDVVSGPSSVISGWSVIGVLSMTLLICTSVYYYLATHFISFYSHLVAKLHSSMKAILAVIIVLMAVADIYVSEANTLNYIFLLIFYFIIGIIIHKKSWNPIPFMFALLLGDKIVWTYIQYYLINFG